MTVVPVVSGKLRKACLLPGHHQHGFREVNPLCRTPSGVVIQIIKKIHLFNEHGLVRTGKAVVGQVTTYLSPLRRQWQCSPPPGSRWYSVCLLRCSSAQRLVMWRYNQFLCPLVDFSALSCVKGSSSMTKIPLQLQGAPRYASFQSSWPRIREAEPLS